MPWRSSRRALLASAVALLAAAFATVDVLPPVDGGPQALDGNGALDPEWAAGGARGAGAYPAAHGVRVRGAPPRTVTRAPGGDDGPPPAGWAVDAGAGASAGARADAGVEGRAAATALGAARTRAEAHADRTAQLPDALGPSPHVRVPFAGPRGRRADAGRTEVPPRVPFAHAQLLGSAPREASVHAQLPDPHARMPFVHAQLPFAEGQVPAVGARHRPAYGRVPFANGQAPRAKPLAPDGGQRAPGAQASAPAAEARAPRTDAHADIHADAHGEAHAEPRADAPRGVPARGAPGLALESVRRSQAMAAAEALAAQAERVRQRLAAYRRWGLKRPLPASAAPPVLKSRVRGAKVVRRVPTDDKVIFLTIDDGAEKDPEFLDLVRELDLPVASFLTHEEAGGGAGYDYFRELERLGGSTYNHTLHHPYLPALSYERQRKEICGQQARIKREFGGPEPRLFRPPFGEYDKDTLRAARACGVDAVVLWGMEAWADRIDFQERGRRLYPGAIILTHYRGPSEWGGTMADMTRRLLRLAADQGYSVGRLEDYL